MLPVVLKRRTNPECNKPSFRYCGRSIVSLWDLLRVGHQPYSGDQHYVSKPACAARACDNRVFWTAERVSWRELLLAGKSVRSRASRLSMETQQHECGRNGADF